MTAPKSNIKFSYNWNNKLNNIIFTTIRKANSIYEAGKTYDLYLKVRSQNATLKPEYSFIGQGEIIEKITTQCGQLPNYICWQDTGYSKGETMRIIQKIWKVPDEQIESFVVDVLFIKKLKHK
jgi:hypothetical protein